MSTEEKWVSATPIFASGEYLAQMCNEIDRLRAEVARLREEREAAESRAARLGVVLQEIARIIEAVDTRCAAADGPVTPTLREMRQEELSRIYQLATRTHTEAGDDGGAAAEDRVRPLALEAVDQLFANGWRGPNESASDNLSEGADAIVAAILRALTPTGGDHE